MPITGESMMDLSAGEKFALPLNSAACSVVVDELSQNKRKPAFKASLHKNETGLSWNWVGDRWNAPPANETNLHFVLTYKERLTVETLLRAIIRMAQNRSEVS